jgi:hypothetical protein
MKDLKDLDNFALTSHSLQAIYLPKTQNIIMSAFRELNHQPKDILSLNENWATLFLEEQGLSVTLLSETKNNKKYDTILALDETLCRYNSESSQKQAINNLLNLLSPNGIMLASIRDYRNGNFHRRPLGDTMLNEIDGEEYITVEVNQHLLDKQAWNQKMYLIKNHEELEIINCGDYRTLYFKQLAKYSNDLGNTGFGIFKEIYWRGTWRRSPEHIAWIKKN